MSGEIVSQISKFSKTARLDAHLRSFFILVIAGVDTRDNYKKFLTEVDNLLLNYFNHSSLCKGAPEEVRADLKQEVLLKIHKYRQSYNPSYPITPWIYSIAQNTAIDYLRNKNNRTSHVEYREEFAIDHKALELEAHLALRDELNFLLEKLPDDKKRIFLASKLLGESHEEISKDSGMSVSAVKVSIHRTIKFLKMLREK